MATVLLCPDSFKGTLSAAVAAEAMATGWLSVRPDDTLLTLPMADGGEGTLDAVARAHPTATTRHTPVTGPDGNPVLARWLMLANDTAVMEIAETSGLPLMSSVDPIGATTRGLGEVMAEAMRDGARKIIVALGGSATTDGGLGALEALGLEILRRPGSRGVLEIAGIDQSVLPTPPEDGITALVDTTVTMTEAPAVFGPQKGASLAQVEALTEAFRELVTISAGEATSVLPGSGAAGATAWGLATFLGAEIVDGAAYVAELIGVNSAMDRADFVITGEGKFDQTSLTGKVVGYLHALAAHSNTPGALIVGNSDGSLATPWEIHRLVDLAGSESAAMAAPGTFITSAAALIAQRASDASWLM